MPNDRTLSLPPAAPFASVPDAAELSLRAVYDQLWNARWTVVRLMVKTFLLGVLFLLLWPKSWQADGFIQVDAPSGNSAVSQLAQLGVSVSASAGGTATEMAMLKTRAVLDPVIARNHLEIDAHPRHFPLLGGFIGTATSDAPPHWAPPGLRYFAWGGEKIVVESMDVPHHWLNSGLTLVATGSNSYSLRNFWGSELLRGSVGSLASGQGGFRMLVRELRAQPGTRFSVTRYSDDMAYQNLIGILQVAELATGSGSVQVSYVASTPEAARSVIADLQTSYLSQNAARHEASAQHSLGSLQEQLPPLKAKLDDAQRALADFQQAHASANVSGETSQMLAQSSTLETRRLQIVTELDKLRQTFTAEHPSVRSLHDQLASVEREQASLKDRMNDLPPLQQQVLRLTQEVETYSTLYQNMLRSMQTFDIARAGTVSNVQVIDAPLLPVVPHFPLPVVTLALSVVLGGMIGVAWVFVRRSLLRGVEHPDALRDAGVHVSVVVPHSEAQALIAHRARPAKRAWRSPLRNLALKLQERRAGRPDLRSGALIASVRPDDAAVDALRRLREHVASRSAGSGQIVLLGGPIGGSGSSFVAANLAAVMVQGGQRVVLVDADLRAGALHEVLGTKGLEAGVGDYVAANVPLETVIRPTKVKGLDLVSRGTRDGGAAEILTRPRFAELLRELASRYDVVVVDAAPLSSGTGATLIGRHAQTGFLVLAAARHRPDEIDAAIAEFAEARVPFAGVVFNDLGGAPGSHGHVDRLWSI